MTQSSPTQHDAADQSGVKVWSSPAWQDMALAWLDKHLAEAGIVRTGEIDCAHVRLWAEVFRVPTTAGPVWLKAAGPPVAFEADLYPLLYQAAPKYVLNPIAADVERGRLVLPDGGVPLADHVPKPDLIESMVTLLPYYGQLQRDLVPHVAGLRALGVPNMSPVVMPRRFAKALSVVGRFAASEGDEADRAMVQRVAGLSETFAGWCGALAASPVAPSLDHNDLHPGNILVTGTGGPGQARFFDWGDSVVAHPFTSLLIPLRSIRHELGVSDGDPALRRVRDAYLEVFSDLAPHTELVTTLETACQVGKVARTLIWASTALGTSEQRRDLRRRATQWLGFLLDDSYLGSV